jgi:D-alanyl-D-alanine carboxypeptidase
MLSTPASAEGRYAAFVMDARSSEVLLSDQADERRFPASLTKMMTLYLLFDAIERGDVTMDTRLTASRHAANQPASHLGVAAGDTLTVEDAIYALVVNSANDVAVMVGEHLAGSEERFATQMTRRAMMLGMLDTRFANASGLPNPLQTTTARDMARLGQALWTDFPDYYCYFEAADFTWGAVRSRNHNRLLRRAEGVDGIKTGYTRASGYNVTVSAERDGRRLIVVVMGGDTAAERDAQASHLLDVGFEESERRDTAAAASQSLASRQRVLISDRAGGAQTVAEGSAESQDGE